MADDIERDEDERDGTDDEGDALGQERARKAATALGVGDEPEESTAAEEPSAPQNRAERRRELALKRRKGSTADADAEGVPRDRNARKRQELLEKRRRSGAADGDEPSDVSLAVDDALARSGAAATRWFQRNWRWLQWVLAAGVFAGIGVLAYVWRSGTKRAEHSDLLASAVAAEQAPVIAPDKDKRTEDEKKKSDRLTYGSYEERTRVALERYQKAAEAAPGSGTAILAQMGLAGAQLDARSFDDAITSYESVLRSKLADADVDVKGRALEGIGFANEGKKDSDKALAAFDRLGELSEPTFKLLAKYHRARVLVGKGDKDGAKKLLEEARKEVETAELDVKRVTAGSMNPYGGLRGAIEHALQRLDPSAMPKRFIPGGAGQQIPPEILKQLLEKQGGLPVRPE